MNSASVWVRVWVLAINYQSQEQRPCKAFWAFSSGTMEPAFSVLKSAVSNKGNSFALLDSEKVTPTWEQRYKTSLLQLECRRWRSREKLTFLQHLLKYPSITHVFHFSHSWTQKYFVCHNSHARRWPEKHWCANEFIRVAAALGRLASCDRKYTNTHCYSNTYTNIYLQKGPFPKRLIQVFIKSFSLPVREQTQSHEMEAANAPHIVWITGHLGLKQVMGNSLWEIQHLTETLQNSGKQKHS